jgi:hypothetical protein
MVPAPASREIFSSRVSLARAASARARVAGSTREEAVEHAEEESGAGAGGACCADREAARSAGSNATKAGAGMRRLSMDRK